MQKLLTGQEHQQSALMEHYLIIHCSGCKAKTMWVGVLGYFAYECCEDGVGPITYHCPFNHRLV